MGIKVVGYKEARKEYFEALKAKHERSLTYWLRLRKGASVHEGYEIDEKCSNKGCETYNKLYRVWLRKPTQAEMDAAGWGDAE